MVRLRLKLVAFSNQSVLFTIHYGEIKTVLNSATNSYRVLFTIHYGEIKTGMRPGELLGLEYLQSTMVRLRQDERNQRVSVHGIYNPLW